MTDSPSCMVQLVPLVLAVFLAGAPGRAKAAEPAAAGSPPADMAAIAAAVPADPEEPLWGVVDSLARLGQPAVPELSALAAGAAAPRRQRIAAAAPLLRLGRQRDGALALEKIILDHEAPPDERIEAADYLGGPDCGDYASARLGVLVKLEALPERVRVALAAGLLRLDHVGQGLLETFYREGKSERARQEALLALARVERDPKVHADALRELAARPGALGARAQTQLALDSRYRAENSRYDSVSRVVNEVIDHILHRYNKDETDKEEDKQLSPAHMQTVAARAILQSIDPYNDYLDEEDLAAFKEQMNAHYGGIGAWVGMRGNPRRFTVLTPMYNQPAQLAGLRPMDVILQIDGTDLKDMDQNDIIKLLKGPPGTKINLKVHRRGWNEAVTFPVTRELIQMESVERQLLPGGIGYIRVIAFNDGDPGKKIPGTGALVARYAKEFEQAGARGIVLDLTNNPGGLLVAGVDTAKVFIGDGKLIVSSRGRPDAARPLQQFLAGGAPAPCRLPLVVMINKGSASASEIVAGALQDHGRAKLVGQTTFGKGSVQQVMNVWSTQNKTNLRLTIAKYYLPNGECIHRTGIKPDVEVDEPFISAAEAESRFLLRDRHDVQFWLESDGRWRERQGELRALLAYDGGDPGAYAGIDEFLAELKQKHPKQLLDREMLRKEIRHGVASYLRDFLGEPWYVDWMESYTLQEALLALGGMIGGLPDVPEYTGLAERVAKNRQRAAEEKASGERPAEDEEAAKDEE